MQIFLTGATKQGDEQKDPTKSLGGHVSGSQAQNDLFNNLFGDISPQVRQNDQVETKGIAIYNETGSALTSLRCWITQPASPHATYELAFVTLAEDSCGFYMETLPNRFARPFSATFNSADGEPNALALPDLAAGAYLGVWVRRTLTALGKATPSCASLYADYTNETAETVEETHVIVFDYA